MTAAAALLWLLNTILDVGGQLAFKRAAASATGEHAFDHWRSMAAAPWLWLGIVAFAAEFFVWMAFLTLVALSVGVMLGSVSIIVLMIAGRLLFGEMLTPWRVAGIALIACGVTIVGAP
ncbi:MAG: EamA family transporter [Gammaproteobacteria bacterium]